MANKAVTKAKKAAKSKKPVKADVDFFETLKAPVKKSSSSKVALVEANEEVVAAVANHLRAKAMKDEAEQILNGTQDVLRGFFKNHMLKAKKKDSIRVNSEEGGVTLIQMEKVKLTKESYGKVKEIFKDKKVDLDAHVTETKEIAFNYSAMTQDEKAKLAEFMATTFGAERKNEILTPSISYKTDGLVNKILEVSGDYEEFESIYDLAGVQNPTVKKA